MILGLIIGAASFVVFILLHFVIWRLVPPSARARTTQLLVLCCMPGIPIVLWASNDVVQNRILAQGAFWLSALCGVLLFMGLFVLYMPFYYVVAASLSVRTAILLDCRPGRSLALRSLRKEFVSPHLIGQRLEIMTENGFLQSTWEGFVLTGKGRRVALFFDFLKHYWKLGPGG